MDFTFWGVQNVKIQVIGICKQMYTEENLEEPSLERAQIIEHVALARSVSSIDPTFTPLKCKLKYILSQAQLFK